MNSLVLGRAYKHKNSTAVPHGTCISRGEKAYWVHIMGPDFTTHNGEFALYSESGKYIGQKKDSFVDLDPSAPIEPAKEEEFSMEEDFSIPVEEEDFKLDA